MKKLLVMLLSFLLIFTMLSPCSVLAAEGEVRIEFCVGDDTLLINGDAVKVEKPYVVGDGVTLVPLRVITEAFGATVEWIDSTQSVNLTYPDVNIHLQINNPVAEVNNKAETLLSAPELTESGYTMVPLRFISENFGATVSYDEKTEKITVVKDNTTGSLDIIEGAITTKMVGDSYYKWSIENSADIKIDDRSFDGTYTAFVYDENNYFDVVINALPEEYDFEREFMDIKASFQGYTLVKADKDNTDAKKQTMHFQAKDKTEFADIKIFITDKYIINLIGSFENEKADVRNECTRIMSTFDCVFDKNETYDLSNVTNGMRTYKADNINLSFSVPADFILISSEDSENEFHFARLDTVDYFSTVAVCVYSKSDVGSAEKLSAFDFAHNQSVLNENIAKFSLGIASKQYDNFKAYEYTYTVDGFSQKSSSRDAFFELGDYVYNVSVTLDTTYPNIEGVMYKVINSVSAEKIDSEKVGILMRNLLESTGTYESTLGEAKLTVPYHYEEESTGTNGAAYINMKNAVTVVATVIPEGETSFYDLMTQCNKIEKLVDGVTVVSPAEVEILGKNRVICMSVAKEEEDIRVCVDYYAIMKDGVGYTFSAAFPEISYSKAAREEIKEIVTSIAFK